MCGIIGAYCANPGVCATILFAGLKYMQNRGYDSAGVAVVRDGALDIRRSAGKLVNLEKVLEEQPLDGEFGIGVVPC